MEQNNAWRETHTRSIMKAITYRLVVIALDFSFVYLLTRRVDAATMFVVAINLYRTVAYYLHERVWSGVKWGVRIG